MSNNRSENPEVSPVILSKESLKTDRTHWYCGDKREPARIFEEGFKARGDNSNLIEHVHGNASGPIKDSAYISTSIFEDAASRYPKDFIGRSYIYLINPQKTAVDVNQALVVEIDAGRMLREDVSCYWVDHERAVPYQIKKEHIKGAWVADSLALTQDLESLDCLYEREIHHESFISNPHYVKPLSKTVASIKLTGAGLTVLGIYFDTTCLWEAYQSKDNERFFSETARVVGGWTGAVALGRHWGKQGALTALRFTKHPGAVLAGGVVGAVAGSVLGYTGGGLIAQEAYERPSVWTDLYQTLKRLEPDHKQIGDVQPAKPIESDVFEKLNAFWTSFKEELQEEGSIGGVIRKHLPATSPGKPDLMAFLKRLDYRDASDSISAQRTAEMMFGPLQEDLLHPHSELLKHAKIVDDEHPAKMFRDAKVELTQRIENHHHQALEKAYRQAYELTDRVKNIRLSLIENDASALGDSRYYAEDFKESADIANSWAMTFNSLGDKATGRKLAAIGSGLGQASMGATLLSLEQASLLQTFGGYSAWIAAGAVFISLFSSDDEQENESLQILMNAIVQLGQALQHVLKNQEKMMDLMQVTLKSIHDVDARLRQFHAESQVSFEFIVSLELQNACLALQDDLSHSNAVSLTTEDRRKALSTLERWLKQHLFSPVMNKSASAPTTPLLAVELMSKQPGLNIMGFVMTQLQNYLGEAHIPSKFTQLPPLLLFIGVSHLFLEAMLKAEVESDDACSNLLSKLQDVINTYSEMAEFIQQSEILWSSLFAQYEHQRNMAGRALAAANIPNQAVPIDSLVTNDIKRRNLMDALDQMEEKRLLLVRLMEFAFDGHLNTVLHQKVQALESKQHILSTPASSFHQYRGTQYYYPENATKDDSGMQFALRAGVDLNLAHLGGNVLNYIGCRMVNEWGNRPCAKQWETDLMHLIMRHSSANERLDASMMSTYRPANTWPEKNYAMTMASNKGRYGFALLLMIAGFSKPWNRESLLNSDWAAESCSRAREYQCFLSSTIRPDGVLNGYKLKRAFDYYQACKNGEIRKADSMIQEGVDADCVLWLVALLGDWSIFEKLNQPVHLAQTLGTFKFTASHHYRGYVTLELSHDPAVSPWHTSHSDGQVRFSQQAKYTPLMVAAEHGRADVIEGMIRAIEAGHEIGVTHTLSWGDSSATLAFAEGHFNIAQRLVDLGAPLAADKRAILTSKALKPGPLNLIKNPISELLEKSHACAHGVKMIEQLQHLSLSMQGFSDAFKWVLNSKIRRLMQAIQQQDNLKKQLEQFDNMIAQMEFMSSDGHVSSQLIHEFKAQQHLLYDFYEKLQAKVKRIAKIHHESYEYDKSEPSVYLENVMHADDVFDESVLKDEYMTRVSLIAQDFGIQFDKVFSLIEEAAIYHQSQTSFTDNGILLLGATGTGKSTLLNFMSGCLYQKTKKAGKSMRELIRGHEISETSHRARAQTRFPVVFNHESYSIVDLAGFLDNTENTSVGKISSYDIVAAISMELLSKKFKTISGLIACCTQAQLTAERPPLELQETFRHIGRIIKDNPELTNNVRLFITKNVDLVQSEVIEGLQQLAIDFSSDEDMCAFLNIFLNEEEAVHRIIFTDVIDDDKRALYFSELEALTPQETQKFNFSLHSTALMRLREFVGRIVEQRDALIEKIDLLQAEKASLLAVDTNALLHEHLPQIHGEIQDDDSIDSLCHEQALLSDVFSQMTQVDGLLDKLQKFEQMISQVDKMTRLLKRLKIQESIESHFTKACDDLGLCDLKSPKSLLKTFGLFNDSRFGDSIEELSNRACSHL